MIIIEGKKEDRIEIFFYKLKGGRCETKYKDLIEWNETKNVNKDNKIEKK